jgi:hypothetical protein
MTKLCAFHSDMSRARGTREQEALMSSMMNGMNGSEVDEKEQDTPYRDTADDRSCMNAFCECMIGFRHGKYTSLKGNLTPKLYAEVIKRLQEFKKQHVRRAYHEQLQIVIQILFSPVLDSLWAGHDKAALVVNVKCAWTHYIEVCDKLSVLLKTMVLNREKEPTKDGVNLYADPESDFRVSAIALFRNRLLELEPLLMDACGEFVVRVLNGEDLRKLYAADDEPLRVLVTCYISMHDCSSLYNQKKYGWATDRKSSEPVSSIAYDVKPKTDEKELYCRSGGLEDALIRAASSWFMSKAQLNFADLPLSDAVSRLRQLFGSTHPSTLRKMMTVVDDVLIARGMSADVMEHE